MSHTRKSAINHVTIFLSYILSSIGVQPRQVVLVGVHARRTDIDYTLVVVLKGRPVNRDYFMRGMDIFRERFHTCSQSNSTTNCTAVAFVMASDDIGWCKETFGHLQDVFFSVFVAKEQDMAMLQACDHSLAR